MCASDRLLGGMCRAGHCPIYIYRLWYPAPQASTLKNAKQLARLLQVGQAATCDLCRRSRSTVHDSAACRDREAACYRAAHNP